MKQTRLLLLAAALALSLTACGGSQTDTPSESDTAEPEVPETEAPAEENGSDDSRYRAALLEFESDTAEHAYGRVLWDAYQWGIVPDLNRLQLPDYGASKFADANSFAVYDVDNDGREELLFCWPNDIVADRAAYILEYANGKIQEEIQLYPSNMIFYDNGVIQEGWSHSQGFAGENFWPYYLNVYDPETDTYETAGAVDAWDVSCYADNFPTDIDQDGDGMVYFLLITDEDWKQRYGSGLTSIAEAAVDGPVYEAWRDSILQDGQPIEIPWLPLTRENIAALGYPEPEMSKPEDLFAG